MSKLRTENNKPNRKVWAGGITGGVVIFIMVIAQLFDIDLPSKEVLTQNVEAVIGGITALIFLIQWLVRPGKGDGIKEDK